MLQNEKKDWVAVSASPEHVARERAKARELRNSQWWKNQLARGICHYCGGHFAPNELTMDHVIPVARGGKSDKNNVVPCCHACNQSKGCLTEADKALAEITTDVVREVRSSDGSPAGSLICGNGACVAVNPSDAQAVQSAVDASGLELSAVFVTDAAVCSGEACDSLHETFSVPVVGGENSGDIELDRIVTDGETVFTQVRVFTVRDDNGKIVFE